MKLGREQSLYHKEPPFCGLSDEITGITLICEYTPVPVDICGFYRSQSLGAGRHDRWLLYKRFYCEILEINSRINELHHRGTVHRLYAWCTRGYA